MKIKTVSALLVIVILFAGISFVYGRIAKYTMASFNGLTIVIDAGHGGRDGGSVGINGTVEKSINLDYALAIKENLVRMGFKVIMTRKNDDGLYSEFAKNKKISDLNKRMEIIKKSNPNLVISVHMNSFSSSSARGAMTYYRKGDEASKNVADLIQKSLNKNCGAVWQNGKVGDYYILNNSYYTSVLIECGFISNPEEEKLLLNNEYKNKFSKSVCDGIGLYFGFVNKDV